MPTRYDDIVAAAQEHDIFTSRNIIVVPPPTGQVEGPYAGVAAPQVFGSDDYGNAVVLLDPVPNDLEASARRAEANCPERAITLHDEG